MLGVSSDKTFGGLTNLQLKRLSPEAWAEWMEEICENQGGDYPTRTIGAGFYCGYCVRSEKHDADCRNPWVLHRINERYV